MQINLRTDYALRAILEIAGRQEEPGLATRDEIAEAQDIPRRYLAAILNELRKAGLVLAVRGPDGGYRLAKSAKEISLADVIRAVNGPLTQVGGLRPENLSYTGFSENLKDVWLELRSAERRLLESSSVEALLPKRLR